MERHKFVPDLFSEPRAAAIDLSTDTNRTRMVSRYLEATKRLLMFDYDGVLTPIVEEPSAAIPTDRVIRLLYRLSAEPRNLVWIISGRDQNFLHQHLGHISAMGFSAEHGSFMKSPHSDVWENLAEKIDMGWQQECIDVFQKYTDLLQGSFIERKRCALTWHYRRADPRGSEVMANKCHQELMKSVGNRWEVEIMTGKSNLEVRPKAVNKGEIAKHLVERYHNPSAPADSLDTGSVEFVLCVGDDIADEDMFSSLNELLGSMLDADHVFTVTVGGSTKITHAKWHLSDPQNVIDSVALISRTDGVEQMD